MSTVKVASVSLLLAVAVGGSAAAQVERTVAVPDRISCGLCTIVIDTVVTLGAADGAGSLSGHPVSVRVDGLGRYWVIEYGVVPKVFRPDGSFLQAVGRMGQGPGE